MLLKLISHSSDLKKLINDGYEVEINGGHLLVKGIPYVNNKAEVARGVLVSTLTLAGNKTTKPDNHVVYFQGEHPCDKHGVLIKQIKHQSHPKKRLTAEILVDYSFSNKPSGGFYNDYYEKINRYVEIISAPAISLNNSMTAKTFNVIETYEEESPFNYEDTNSSRSEIAYIADRVKEQKIGIIGLGGTGSYILDLVSKTSVKEIHMFDGDTFLQHNAFRAPGAASIEELQKQLKKVDYYHNQYSKMHNNIHSHATYLDSSNIDMLAGLTFVFICMDQGIDKKAIIEYLHTQNIPFIDSGIGIKITSDNQLVGSLRVTTSTDIKNDHIDKRIPFDAGEEDIYSTNIQIVELNSLNATLAVIKWKKLLGIYQDLENEHNSIFSINVNSLVNDDERKIL